MPADGISNSWQAATTSALVRWNIHGNQIVSSNSSLASRSSCPIGGANLDPSSSGIPSIATVRGQNIAPAVTFT